MLVPYSPIPQELHRESQMFTCMCSRVWTTREETSNYETCSLYIAAVTLSIFPYRALLWNVSKPLGRGKGKSLSLPTYNVSKWLQASLVFKSLHSVLSLGLIFRHPLLRKFWMYRNTEKSREKISQHKVCQALGSPACFPKYYIFFPLHPVLQWYKHLPCSLEQNGC